MARERTGTVVKARDGRLQAVITLADGTRKRLPPFPKGTSREMAKAKALHYAEEALRRGLVSPPKPKAVKPAGERGDTWWDLYLAHREGKGMSPVLHLYRPHIEPVLGDVHPKDWTRADCERLVTALDGKIASTGGGKIAWKTAANVWSLFTSACKAASSAKAGSGLRVRGDNPCIGVEGPDRGENREKQWLYPAEFLALVSCETVPLRWRRLYTLLAYLYVRPGELTVLDWETDVDLEVGTVHITKAWDEKAQRVKPPKTRAGVRHVPIEPTLLPLLRALHKEAGGKGRVVQAMPPMEDWAEKFRRHLQRAGVTRAELFVTTATHKRITLYDLRATGITWRCLREDYGPKIQKAAGHEKYDTTDGYIRTAAVFVGRLGEPFPPLPKSLQSITQSITEGPRALSPLLFPGRLVTPAGIEPALPA
jgi:integrase